jgi:hypothetical protein
MREDESTFTSTRGGLDNIGRVTIQPQRQGEEGEKSQGSPDRIYIFELFSMLLDGSVLKDLISRDQNEWKERKRKRLKW